MPFEVSGRQIIENGTAVLGVGEDTVVISAANLRFEIKWVQAEGEQRVEAEDLAQGSVRLNLINAENSMGSTYVVPDAGTLNGRQLGFSIYWQSVHGAVGTSRFFAYMVTVR